MHIISKRNINKFIVVTSGNDLKDQRINNLQIHTNNLEVQKASKEEGQRRKTPATWKKNEE